VQALGDLLVFQRASRFTAHWLADAEAANGPEYRDLVAARFTKLRQILRGMRGCASCPAASPPGQPAIAVLHSSVERSTPSCVIGT